MSACSEGARGMLGGGGGGVRWACFQSGPDSVGAGRGSKRSAPLFPGPQGEPAHGLHPRFVVAEIWADWVYCTVLYYTVLYCTVLYCAVLYCTVLYCTVLYCASMRPHHFLEAPCQRYPLGQLVLTEAGPLRFHALFLVSTLHTPRPLTPDPERRSTTQLMAHSFDPLCEVSIIRV